MIRVGEQREIKCVLVVEFLLLFRLIGAYTDSGDTQFCQVRTGVTNAACLFRASGSISLGIEVYEKLLTLEIGKYHRFAGLIRKLELRRCITGL